MRKFLSYLLLFSFSTQVVFGKPSAGNEIKILPNSDADYALAVVNSAGTVLFQLDTDGAISVMGGTQIAAADIVLENAEVISNDTDDTVRVASNDADLIFSLYSPLTSNGDATLRLIADASADNGDDWQIQHDGATNSLLFQNDTSGSQATKLTLATTGIMTLTAALTLSNADLITNATDDTVRIASEDSDFILEVYSPNATNGAASLILNGDAGADATDRWKIANTAAGNLLFQNDSSVAGTYVTKATLTSGGVLSTALGTVHASGTATDLTASTTVSLTVAAGRTLYTDTITTDNEDQTINASGPGSAGDELTIIFTTDTGGSGDEVITFGTNFYSTGTLTLANLTADIYVVTFISNGTRWIEKARTTVQTT